MRPPPTLKILGLGQNFLLKKLAHRFGRHRKNRVIDGNANALLAFAHTKTAAKLDLVAQIVLSHEILKLIDDLARPFEMTRRSNTDGDFHGLLPYSKSTTFVQESRNSRSLALPLTLCDAATMGIHDWTYFISVPLFSQNNSRYCLAPSMSPASQNLR